MQEIGKLTPRSARLDKTDYRPMTLVASWPSGSKKEFKLVNRDSLLYGSYYHHAFLNRRIRDLLAKAMYNPANLARAVLTSEIEVVLLDLPGVKRRLNEEEKNLFALGLIDTFRVNYREATQPCDPPFPLYALDLKGKGWQARMYFAGEHYINMDEEWYGHTFAHDGSLLRMVQEWLPVPAAKPGELAYLYRAEELKIVETDTVSDLTYWKN